MVLAQLSPNDVPAKDEPDPISPRFFPQKDLGVIQSCSLRQFILHLQPLQLPRRTVLSSHHLVGFGTIGNAFGFSIPKKLVPNPKCNVPQMARGCCPMSHLDIGNGSLS